MSKRKLPIVNGLVKPASVDLDAPPAAFDRWPALAVQASNDATDISIFDTIGENWDGTGWTARKMAAILRNVGDKPLNVSINSPGGDMFEGIAIYNQLAEHPAEVNVKIIGVAASAASVIAMAGDKIAIGAGSFLMIHNAWGIVVGNRHDFEDAAKLFAPFDEAMASIYSARTGLKAADIAKMMDDETWISAQSAVDQGFANEMLPAVTPAESGKGAKSQHAARNEVETILAKQGIPRSERRRMLREIAGTPGAAGTATPSAGEDVAAVLSAGAQLLQTLNAR